MTPLRSIDTIVELFETWGEDAYDEDLSQRDHALQTAALARAAGADDALVAAALLHDIGHLVDLAAGGTASAPRLARHERVGAEVLSSLFDEAVTGPIALHVAAKRHLIAVEPSMMERLSAGSRASLERQGGPMSPSESADFVRHRWFEAACALRRWDDDGKVEGLAVGCLDDHLPTLGRLVRPQR